MTKASKIAGLGYNRQRCDRADPWKRFEALKVRIAGQELLSPSVKPSLMERLRAGLTDEPACNGPLL
jgi:hypothetical protein